MLGPGPKFCCWLTKESGNWLEGILGNCIGFGGCVRSNVMVGNGAEAEIVAMLFEEQGRMVLDRKLVFIIPSALGIDPERSIRAAEDVVEAIAMAAGGNGWLWLPSYVVMSMLLSSAHLWTWICGSLII